MSSSATGVGMTICFLGAILLILTQKSSQKFGDVLGIMVVISLTNYSFFYFEALQSGWVLITVAKVVTSGSDVKCFVRNKHCLTKKDSI